MDDSGLLIPGTSPVMNSILNAIGSGELKAGEKLDGERTLALRFGINRTTVREALKELEIRGFVRRVQGSGTFISSDRDSEHRRSLLGSGSASERRFREVMDLRQALEPEIAFRAAKRSSAETGSLTDILAEAERRDPGELTELARLDTDFHVEVARLTLNPLLLDLLSEAHEVFGFTRRAEFQSESRIRTSLAGHRAIAEAIAHGDGPAARQAMHEHLIDVAQSIVF